MQQRSPTDTTYTINPTHMSKKDSSRMYAFLAQHHVKENGLKFFAANIGIPLTDITLDLPSNFTHIKFTHSVVTTTCNSDPRDHHYDVLDNKIMDAGAVGGIRKVIGKMTMTKYATMNYTNVYHRVAKVLTQENAGRKMESQSAFKQRAQNEYELLSRNDDKARSPTIYRSGMDLSAIITMRYVPGMNMEVWLEKIKTQELDVSTEDLVEIDTKLARELERLHEHLDILHRDIKPANIMVSYNEGVWKIKYIDFGWSCTTQANNTKRAGTPLYCAPEGLEGKLDQPLKKPLTRESDVYSLAWMLGFPLKITNVEATTWEEALRIANNCVFTGVGHGLNMTEQDRLEAQTILQKMVYRDPERRASTNEVVDAFEKILISCMTKGLEETKQQAINAAYQAMVEWRKKQRLFIQQAVEFKVSPASYLNKLVALIEEALLLMPHDPLSTLVCLRLLDLDMLKGLTTKEEIINKLRGLTDSYLGHIDELNNMKNKINALRKSLKPGKFSTIEKEVGALLKSQEPEKFSTTKEEIKVLLKKLEDKKFPEIKNEVIDFLKNLKPEKCSTTEKEVQALLQRLETQKFSTRDDILRHRHALYNMSRRINVLLERKTYLMTFDEVARWNARYEKKLKRLKYELFILEAAPLHRSNDSLKDAHSAQHQDKGHLVVSRQGLFSQNRSQPFISDGDYLLKQAANTYSSSRPH